MTYEPDPARWYDHLFDAEIDLAYQELQRQVEEAVEENGDDRAREYLGRYGDAVMTRVEGALDDARLALSQGLAGPAITSSMTAVEVFVGHMLVRPVLRGSIFSSEIADTVTEMVLDRRSKAPQHAVARLLDAWGIDVGEATLSDGRSAWDAVGDAMVVRNRVVHEGERVAEGTARVAVDAASAFCRVAAASLADEVDLAGAPLIGWHRRWSQHRTTPDRPTAPADPFHERRAGRRRSA